MVSPTSLTCTLIMRHEGGGVEDWYLTKRLLHRLEEWLGPFSSINEQPRSFWHSLLDTGTLGDPPGG